ncbi:MAG TPA: hypothetical protein VGD87_07010 [Archangium sp.]
MTTGLLDRIAPFSNPTNIRFTPVDLTKLSGAKMKGFPLLHLLDLMQTHGADTATRWRDTVPEALRPQTERAAITSVSWIPMEFYFHGVEWLAREKYGGVRGALVIGHDAAKRDIGAFFRMVMSLTSPATILGFSGRFWRSYFDTSTLQLNKTTGNSVSAEIRDWPLRDETSLHEMCGSLVAWLEASRAPNVRMHRFEITRPGTLSLEISWG